MYTIPITFHPSPDSIVQTPTPWGKESDQLYRGPPELVPPAPGQLLQPCVAPCVPAKPGPGACWLLLLP